MTDLPPRWHDLKPGSKAGFHLQVVARADGSPIELPVLAVRGSTPGKTLLVTAGIHGDEFEGMTALHRFYAQLDPVRLRGTFVGVPVANPPAFEAGQRVNPDDRQDLARVFPGDPAGTVTEQIAHTLTYRLIRHADLYCDLHSAGQYYAMPPLVGYQLRAEPLLGMQRQAAKAFGLPLVWGTPGLPGRSLSAAAELGVPAIYAEITGEGRCRPADVNRYVFGLRQMAAYLGMTGETLSPQGPEFVIEDDRAQAGHLQVQTRTPVGGLFEPQVELWQRIELGQDVGVVRSALGAIQHTARAAQAGRVVFLRTFPRVLAGDPLCTVVPTER